MNRLVDNGVEITDPSAILAEQAHYYENLYSDKVHKSNTEIEEYINNVTTPCLGYDECMKCEGPITLEESLNALKTMKNNKSPGNDGISAEFYKKILGCFW